MQINTSKLAAYDGIELKEATFRKRSFPFHFHDSYSIGLIEQGIEQVSFDSKQILAHANAVIIINPYDVHANTYFDQDSWKYTIIYVGVDVMQHFQKQAGLFAGKTVWFPQQLLDDAHLCQLLMQLHIQNDSTTLPHILVHLLQHHAMERPEADFCQYSSLVQDAVAYLHSNLADKITIDGVAARYKTDKYKFIRAFKKQTGLTPVSYLLLQRINMAKTLIAQNLPMTDIALEAGFYDQSHFNHYFKKYIGIAPLCYKRGLGLGQG